MRRVLLVSLFFVGSAVCTQSATSLPFGPTTVGPICNMSKMNDGKSFQRIDVLVRKDGSINWNGTTVTKARFEAYAEDAATQSSPSLKTKIKALPCKPECEI